MKLSPGLLLALLLPLCACAKDAAPPAARTPASSTAPAAAAKVDAPMDAPMDAKDPRVALAARIPGAKPEDLRTTPVAGIYELTHGADVTYVSADGKFAFAGDLYSVTSNGDFPNLTETRRRELRLKLVNEVPESQMLIFGPADAKHTITVFTDIDCPWCRRLHGQMAEYNKQGIRVRYLFFPRSGPDTESWAKAEAVWCATDRKAAMTRSKLGETVPKTAACTSTPVAMGYELGREIGVSGTPGLVLDSGELIPGYLTPTQLVAHLNGAPVAE
jgi:thiol:disulfide interchange protein DsbC